MTKEGVSFFSGVSQRHMSSSTKYTQYARKEKVQAMGEINNDSCEQYIPAEKAPLVSPRRQSYSFLSRPALFHQAQHN